MARDLSKSTSVLCLLLAAVSVAVYWPVGHFAFVNYDDPVYVVENAHVLAGLTWEGIVWAFARLTGEGTYWHPITWLSHMFDCQFFGPNPGPHHLVNLGFHIANALLLFLLLKRMTQAFWRSAVVAALFALHPLQVGTVAWVAERKNVLSTFFFLLTLLAYQGYVKSVEVRRASAPPQTSRSTPHAPRSTAWYLCALFSFALGLMCKPMLVTLPFVLLLLDYWPLGRSAGCGVQSAELEKRPGKLRAADWARLLSEKLPFVAMSGALVWITMAGHRRFSLGASLPPAPLAARLANALVSYIRYLKGTLWPTDMAVLYPFPGHWPVGLVLGAGVLLAGVSTLALWGLRRWPYLAVGWFWFLGTLLPVIGLVQDGAQAMADRYMYVPLIGLLLALCWGTAEITRRLRHPGWAGPIAAVALLGCVCTARYELQFWKNSVALFGRAVAVTQDNSIAEENLGVALGRSGAMEEARTHLAKALQLTPNSASVHFNLAMWLALQAKPAEAAAQYREAIRLRPNYSKAMNNLSWMLATHTDPLLRNGMEALQLARRATDLTGGNDASVLDTLAVAFAETRQFAEASRMAERAAQLAQSAGQNELARQIQARLLGYQADQPYREP